MADDWPEERDGGAKGKGRESQLWDAGLQTEEESYLSTLESKLKSLQSKTHIANEVSGADTAQRPAPLTHHSSRSLDRVYLGSSTSPGGSIGSGSESGGDDDINDGDTEKSMVERLGQSVGLRDDGSETSQRALGGSSGSDANEANAGEEDDPGYPLLPPRDLAGEAEDAGIRPISILANGKIQTKSPLSSAGSPTPRDPLPLSPHDGQPTPGFESCSPTHGQHLSLPTSPSTLQSPPFTTKDKAYIASPPFTPMSEGSPSISRRLTESPGFPHSPSSSKTPDQLRSPSHPPFSDSRTITSPKRSPNSRLSSAQHTPSRSPAQPSPSAIQPTKHINFAPRVRITSGIRVPIPGGSKPGSRVSSASSRVPSGSGTPAAAVPPPATYAHPQPIRQNTTTWNPLPDFGFGGRSIETASLASSVSVSLRTVPVNTWLFPNSIARALMGRRDSGGSVAAIPHDLAAESAMLIPGPPAIDVSSGDDQSSDYFSINPHPGTTPSNRSRGASTPGSGTVTPDLEAAMETPSSRRSSFSFFSRASTLPHHTQEEELIEAEAARRRADVMLFNTPYMRSYSSMIRQEETGSPDEQGGLGGSGARNKGKGRLHTVIKIKSEEDVIWGEDRWTKWKNWKWWVWKCGRWWRAFENFWCAVDDDEEGDGWDY